MSTEERVLSHGWTGTLHAREYPAIDDYPFERLEAAVRERFAPGAAERAAIDLADRARNSVEWRLRRRAGRRG